MERYSVLIKTSAAKEIETIPQRRDRRRIVQRISSLADDPRPRGCVKLAGREERYRVRQGRHRIVYSIDDPKRDVLVVKVGQRKEVYR